MNIPNFVTQFTATGIPIPIQEFRTMLVAPNESPTVTALRRAVRESPLDDAPRLALADALEECDRPDDAADIRLTVQMRRVIAAPDDDEPRLRWAEIAEGAGQVKRAEFVRVQCKLERRYAWKPTAFSGVSTAMVHPLTIWQEKIRELKNQEWELLPHQPTPLWLSMSTTVPKHGCKWSRGFIESVVCSVEHWLAYGDGLVWRPNMTKPCGICNGTGLCRENTEWGCHDCGGNGHTPGTGRVHYPIPLTAQPVRSVTFTARSPWSISEVCDRYPWARPPVVGERFVRCFEREWPGVRFEMPL